MIAVLQEEESTSHASEDTNAITAGCKISAMDISVSAQKAGSSLPIS
jgi:hypothetical protein